MPIMVFPISWRPTSIIAIRMRSRKPATEMHAHLEFQNIKSGLAPLIMAFPVIYPFHSALDGSVIGVSQPTWR